ncbi:MAG: hypothetical protein IKV21_05910 [Clostridia bacterium]|nr:hypothetical protein [Clostridia bacterium]
MDKKVTVFDVALVGIMVAVIEVCKIAMMELPNIELTSFWLIMFSKHFSSRVYFVVPVFILIEGAIFGFGVWWVLYLYAWPLLVLAARFLRKSDSPLTWAILSGVFGLLFGFMCAIPYLFMGGISTAFSWWVAGIPWDFVHGGANFILMMLLYKPVSKAMKAVRKSSYA